MPILNIDVSKIYRRTQKFLEQRSHWIASPSVRKKYLIQTLQRSLPSSYTGRERWYLQHF